MSYSPKLAITAPAVGASLMTGYLGASWGTTELICSGMVAGGRSRPHLRDLRQVGRPARGVGARLRPRGCNPVGWVEGGKD